MAHDRGRGDRTYNDRGSDRRPNGDYDDPRQRGGLEDGNAGRNRDERHRRGGKTNLSARNHARTPVDSGTGERDDRHRRAQPGRSRSRSPKRDTGDRIERERSPQRPRAPRGPRGPRDTRRPPSPSDTEMRESARDRGPTSQKSNLNGQARPRQPSPVDPNEDPEMTAMRRTMGFSVFRTTKNTKVPGNDKNYGVSKPVKTEYRQYMNRVGGFNRPLDEMS